MTASHARRGTFGETGREGNIALEGLSSELEPLAAHSIGNHGTETKTPASESSLA